MKKTRLIPIALLVTLMLFSCATTGKENVPVKEEISITEMEAPIHASNVMIIDPKTKKPTRIGHSTDKKGKKIRIAKKSNESID